MRKINLCIIFIFFASCFSKEDVFLGEKKVKGTDSLSISFYQTREFDMVTPIKFDLKNKESFIFRKKVLFGTNNKLNNAEGLEAFIYNDIFYVCYSYPNICFLDYIGNDKKIKSKEDLFKELKLYDKNLKLK